MTLVPWALALLEIWAGARTAEEERAWAVDVASFALRRTRLHHQRVLHKLPWQGG